MAQPQTLAVAKVAASRSVHLPIQEVFYIIDQGFSPDVGRYDQSRWIDPPIHEVDIADTLQRYQSMIGLEEFQALSTMICFLRLTKRVCSQCGVTDRDLSICSRCRLTFYCSGACQRAHWIQHKTWCMKRFSTTRDTGPASVVLMPLNKNIVQE